VGFSNERRKTIYRNGNDRVDTMLKDKVLEQALQKVQILKMLIGRCTENKYNKNKLCRDEIPFQTIVGFVCLMVFNTTFNNISVIS
jgi:hypothetical protein